MKNCRHGFGNQACKDKYLESNVWLGKPILPGIHLQTYNCYALTEHPYK